VAKILKLKHLAAVRWFHWVNFPLLFLMLWSGFLIYWANDEYVVSIGSLQVFHFFPDWVYSALHSAHRLADGMALHFVFMWLFVLNGVLYVAYTVFSGEWRYLTPQKWSAFRDAWGVVLYDLRLRKQMPPQEKYNAAQQITYTAIICMGVGSVVTGFAIYKPMQLYWLAWLLGGYEAARLWHFLLAFGYVGFFVVHIAQVVRAGWSNFRAMVMGYEMEPANEVAHEQGAHE
jgi:thiosulfate reductase cytochrome b subunit